MKNVLRVLSMFLVFCILMTFVPINVWAFPQDSDSDIMLGEALQSEDRGTLSEEELLTGELSADEFPDDEFPDDEFPDDGFPDDESLNDESLDDESLNDEFLNDGSLDDELLDDEPIEKLPTDNENTNISSKEIPDAYKGENTFIKQRMKSFGGGSSKKVLLVEDVDPWNSIANQQVLGSISEYQKVTTSQFLNVDLSEYGVIVFANDQPFSSYDKYSEFKEYMELFASIGGVIVFGACDSGWAGGTLIEKLPGDVSKKTHYVLENHISDYTHSIVTASLSDNIPLSNKDLVGSYCSHVSFDEESLPAGSKIILRENDTNRPTLVEYPLGKGRVIASGLTWEFTYQRAGQEGSYGPIGYFAQKAMDDMFLYAIRVSNIEVSDLSALTEYYIDRNGHYIITADRTSGSPLQGSIVSIDDKTYETDENGMVKYSDTFGKYTVVVTAEGYKNNKQYYNLAPGTSRIIFMEPDKNDGLPYISMVTDTKQLLDLRQHSVQFTENDATMLNLAVDGEWLGHPGGSYMLYQEGAAGKAAGKSIKSQDGLFSFAPGKSFNPEQAVKLKMVSADGTSSKAIKINLAICKKNDITEQFNNAYDINNLTNINLGGDVQDSDDDSRFRKLFPVDFSVKGAIVPVEVKVSQDEDGYTLKGVIGFKSGEYTRGLLKGEDEVTKKEWSNLKKDVLKAKKLYKDREELMKKRADKLKETSWRNTVDAELKVCGFFEIKLDTEGNISSSSGGFIVEGKGEYKLGKTFLLGPVPAYFELQIGVEPKFTGELKFYSSDKGFGFNLDGSIKANVPTFALGGGVGVRGVATVGIKGKGELQMQFVPEWEGIFEARGEVNIKVLFVVDFKWTLAKGRWQLWPKTKQAGIPMLFSDANMKPELSLVSREYAKKTTAWRGTRGINLFDIIEDESDTLLSLQDWIMPNSIPRIIKVGNDLILLFQTDDATRATGNNTLLMYSIYNNGNWEMPQPVWDTGTSDLFYKNVVAGDELYLVWQKQKTTVTKTDPEDLLEEVSRNSEICYAKWNKDNKNFEGQKFVTDNDVLDMYPTIAVDKNEISVLWVSNNESDPLGITGEYSVMKATSDNGGFGTPVKLLETTDYIGELAAGYVDNKLKVSYIAENKDDDIPYVYLIEGAERILPNSDGGNAIIFSNESFYWQSEGTLFKYDIVRDTVNNILAGEESVITSSYKLVKNNNKSAVVWVDIAGEIYSIKTSILSEDGWSAPITLIESSDYSIEYMDVELLDNGLWKIILNIQDNDSEMSSLVYANVNTKTDVELSFVYADEYDRVDFLQPINYTVTNLGENKVERLHLVIKNDNKTYVDKFIDCNIEAGASADFTENIDVSDIISVTDVDILIVSEDETDLSNNTGSVQLGLVDVSISLSRYQIDETIVVSAYVCNDSKTPANVGISVVEDSPDGIVLDMKNIGILDNKEDYVYTYSIDTTAIDFNEKDNKIYYFKVSTLEPNINEHDNTKSVIVYSMIQQEISMEEIDELNIIYATGINVEQDDVTLILDDETKSTARLTAVVTPEHATYKDVIWDTKNADIVYVDSQGALTARDVGKTEVTVTSYDGEFVDRVSVTVIKKDTKHGLKILADSGGTILTGKSGEYFAGENISIKAKADSGYSFKKWSSSHGGTFGNDHSERTIFIMPDNPTTITAYFEKDTTSSGGGGWGGGGSYEETTVPKPKADIPTGEVIKGTSVKLFADIENGKIYYTLDGSTPTEKSTLYGEGITIEKDTLIKAITIKDNVESGILTLEYKVKPDETEPSNKTEFFTDVSTTDWFYEAVRFIAERKLTQGVTETSYDPHGKVTRAQFITMLCRAFNIEERTGDNFSDAGNTWYTGHLAAAKQLGISSGIGDNKFAPEKEITREEMVTLLYNYMVLVDGEPTDKSIIQLMYSDKDEVSDWAVKALSLATAQGWIKGKENNVFDPRGTATRAELAQIFYNILG